MKKIALIMGSISDADVVKETSNILKSFKVPFEAKVLSAHRTPKDVTKYVEGLSAKNTKVIIAYAGMAAALSGVVAAHTTIPVIGVPVETRSLKGLDSLLFTVQLPSGIPVAGMSIGKSGAKNAAIFALEILALTDKTIATKLLKFKKQLGAKVRKIKKINLWKQKFTRQLAIVKMEK